MDPITKAVYEYNEYLRYGGDPVCIGDGTKRTKKRKLHPSGVGPGLCDRKAAFSVMKDIGEIEPDLPHPPELLLDFLMGNVIQDFISAALEWKGALVGEEIVVEDDDWTGRIDQVVDPTKLDLSETNLPKEWYENLWDVDVKTSKGKQLYRKFYPKPYYIAQVTRYANMLNGELSDGKVVPVLYHAARVSLGQTLFVAIQWIGNDALAVTETGKVHKTFRYLADEIAASERAQLKWLHNGGLPNRCGSTPDEHPFLCCKINRKSKVATPSCPFFGRCWDVDTFEPFKLGAWDNGKDPF
jgi:hypothetical protein